MKILIIAILLGFLFIRCNEFEENHQINRIDMVENVADSLFAFYSDQEVLEFDYDLNRKIEEHYSLNELLLIINNRDLNSKVRVAAFEIVKFKVDEDQLISIIKENSDDSSLIDMYSLGVKVEESIVRALIKQVYDIEGIDFSENQKKTLGLLDSELR